MRFKLSSAEEAPIWTKLSSNICSVSDWYGREFGREYNTRCTFIVPEKMNNAKDSSVYICTTSKEREHMQEIMVVAFE